MALTYNTWFVSFFNNIAAVSTATPIGPSPSIFSSYTDPFWNLELPNIIDYAEQRLFRDLDLLNWRITDDSGILTAQQRTFPLPTTLGRFQRLEVFSVFTTSSDAFPALVLNPLVPVSRAMIDFSWPSNSTFNGVPQVYAMQDDKTVILGPTPDQNYPVECVGPQTPNSLSLTNQTTYLSITLPDLFFAATMVRASAYMRDFGSMAESPAQSVSWEGQYQALLKGADMQEAARQYRSAGWTAQVPKEVTAPPRV